MKIDNVEVSLESNSVYVVRDDIAERFDVTDEVSDVLYSNLALNRTSDWLYSQVSICLKAKDLRRLQEVLFGELAQKD